MLFLPALLLAASPPATAAPPFERALLDSFKSACSRVDDLEAMKADALASGWEEIAEEAEPRIEKLLKLGREAIGDEGVMTGAYYARSIEGRRLFLLVTRYEDKEGYWGHGCRIYDFAATAALDPAGLEAWMGKPPTGVQDLGDGLGKRLWEPGWRDGMSLEINHVPHDHPMGLAFGIEGNVLLAQAMGGFDKLLSEEPAEAEPEDKESE
jgi:hypothetical protein